MKVDLVKISDLKHAEYNPRFVTDEDVEQIKKSIEEFGFAEPLVVNSAPGREGVIIGGNQRFEVAKRLGIAEIPVHFMEIPEIERERELNLRLNKNQGRWDPELLKLFDRGILLKSGFSTDELDDYFKTESVTKGSALGHPFLLDVEPAFQCKPGDVFKLNFVELLAASYLAVCSPVDDLHEYLPYLNDGHSRRVFPFAGLLALVLKDQTRPFTAIQPNPFIAGHMMDQFMRRFPEVTPVKVYERTKKNVG